MIRIVCTITIVLSYIILFQVLPVSSQQQQELKKWTGKLADGKILTKDDLKNILADHKKWLESDGKEGKQAELSGANLSGAMLHGADLRKANLSLAIIDESNLYNANLSGANLSGANLRKASLSLANLIESNLYEAILANAILIDVDLSGANLSDADLSDADLSGANLNDVVFEPKLNSLPIIHSLALARNLHKIKHQTTPIVLVKLREEFKKDGWRSQVKEITCAIYRSQRLASMRNGNYFEKSLGLLSYILLELTCQYGRKPSNAFFSLIIFIPFFSIFYIFAIKTKSQKTGLWLVFLKERVLKTTKKERPFKLSTNFPPRVAPTKKLNIIKLGMLRSYRMIRIAVYFSLLSAFSIGFREFNVGNWLSRLQRREYLLKATGWVRSVSGFQSLLSVYLLALWVVTFLVGLLKRFE